MDIEEISLLNDNVEFKWLLNLQLTISEDMTVKGSESDRQVIDERFS